MSRISYNDRSFCMVWLLLCMPYSYLYTHLYFT